MMAEQMDPGEVRTREDLSRFLAVLARSRAEYPESWENDSLETFLEAWAAWLDDMDGYFANRGEEPPDQPTWALIGQMLLAARVYE